MNFTYVSATNQSCSMTMRQSSCFVEVQMCIDCSCDQAFSKGRLCESMISAYQFYDNICQTYLNTIFICIGALANTLLLLTLMQKTFSKAITFVYVKLIGLISLALVTIQLTRKIMSSYPKQFAGNFSVQLFFYSSSYISDFVKLFVSTLSTFMCLDRLISVVYATDYVKFSNPKSVVLAVLTSILIASLTVIYAGNVDFEYDPQRKSYNVRLYNLDNGSGGAYDVDNAIFGIRLVQVIVMLSVTVVIVIKMTARNQRLRDAMTNATLHREESKTINLCKFQFLETFVIAVDLSMLCLNQLAAMLPQYERWYYPHTYQQYLGFVSVQIMFYVTAILQTTSYQFSQFMVFFLYLGFSKMFREGFIRMIRKPFKGFGSSVAPRSTALGRRG